MTNLLKNKRGVTLVELLAVIIILGIIAAIAVPTIGNLIENQEEKAAFAEWTNVQEAARLYVVDNPTGEITMANLASYLSDTVELVATDDAAAPVLTIFTATSGVITVHEDVYDLTINGVDIYVDGVYQGE